MHFYNLFTWLALHAAFVAGAPELISPGISIERLASDDLSTSETVRSFEHEESGATNFELRAGSLPVREAAFLSRNLDGRYYPGSKNDGFVIFRISLFFENGESKIAGDHHYYNAHYGLYDQYKEGDILNMTIYSGFYVDAVSYTTEDGEMRIGGSGGQPNKQDVGNGVLLGFKGTLEDGYVKTLEAIFKH